MNLMFFITWLIHSLTSPGVVDICPLHFVLRKETPLLLFLVYSAPSVERKCEHFQGHYMMLYELSYKVWGVVESKLIFISGKA